MKFAIAFGCTLIAFAIEHINRDYELISDGSLRIIIFVLILLFIFEVVDFVRKPR